MDLSSDKKIEHLVRQHQRGQEIAFRNIFEHLSDKIFMYMATRTATRDDALDITQETFIDLWSALRKFRYKSDGQFYAFVFTIAKRKLYKHYRKSNAMPESALEDISETNGYNMELEDYRHLINHLETLSAKQQDLIRLRYWSDMTFAEIANILGMSETNTKVLHHRTIKKLQILITH